MVLNAPGEVPSEDRIEAVTRQALELVDRPNKPTPAFCTTKFTAFLTDNPGDDNFLLELPEKNDATKGGNGFGTITCMEDMCWQDILLTADPELADGGRSAGLGSMYEFAVHCRTAEHISSRDERLLRKGVQIPTKASNVAVLPEDIVHNRAEASSASSATPRLPGPTSSNSSPHVAVNVRTSSFAVPLAATPKATVPGPSTALNSSTQTTSSASRLSSVLSEHSLNAPDVLMGSPDIKPRIINKGKAKEVVMDSDDDEIVFVKAIQGRPAVKAPNVVRPPIQKSIIVIDSDEDEDENTRPKTSNTQPRSSVPNTPSASQMAAHVVRWKEMTIHERMAAVVYEMEALAKIRPTRPEDRTVLQMRRSDLKGIKSSFGIRQWTPPPQTVLRLITRAAIHPSLVDTISSWPVIVVPPVVTKPEPSALMPGAFPGSVAGPSTQLWPANAVAGSSTYPTGAGSTIHLGPALTPAVAGPAQWNAAWDRIPIAQRKSYSAAEVGALGSAYKRTNPKHHATKMEILSRHALAIQRCTAPAISKWTPMSASLLANCAALRTVTHPDLQQFLPTVGAFGLSPVKALGDDLDAEDYGFGYEHDRPQTASELSTFFQEALHDFKEDATVEDGLKKLNLNSLADQMPGANFTLLAHQVLGVAFMVAREERKSGSKGGLLCDAMGLGKTVQCLGLMLQRNTRPDDFKKAPQLIVAPVALLEQWKAEIETKTTVRFKVFIHHGSNKLKSVNAMKKYDIILTSYGTLRAEAFPRGMKKKKKKKRGAQPNSGAESSSESDLGRRTSVLLRTKWFRVILDEAHNARNKRTACAQSILKLDCLHPWYLSGTPIVNTLGDLGPALNFIGAMADEDFHKKVVKMEKRKPRLAAKRMQAILKPIVMRRNKESEINGQKILSLPPKTTNMPQLPFQPEERAIYSAIEQRAKVRVNKFIREGTLMKNYQVILVLLLRLRQCVNHPWLLRRKPGEAARDDDLLVDGDAFGANLCQTRPDDSDEYGRAIALIGQDDVNNLVKKLEDRHLAVTAEDDDREDSPDMECSICYEPFDGQELITKCGHVFCKGCLDNLFGQPLRDETTMTDEEVQRGCRICPMCRGVLESGHAFRTAALFQPEVDAPEAIDDDEDEDDNDIKPMVDRKGKGRADGKGKKRGVPSGADFFKKKRKLEDGEAEEAEGEVDELDLDAIEEENQIPPSSKMRHLLELVQGYLEEDPTTKILVFSQFVQFLDLLSDFLNVHGIRNIGYRGAMGPNERSEAIRRFSMPSAITDSISVMLISTKAGGVGLNLTMANKVICCDLAWNPATENQAVDRAHRIGQTKAVQVERLVIENTVEDRLLQIQEEKGLLADGAMGEGEVGKIGRLTVEHIRTLFGIDREHEAEDH